MKHKAVADDASCDYEESEHKDKTRRKKKILNHASKLKHISPITENQEKAFHSFFSGQNLLLHGSAGTGKTYIALYFALNELLKGYCNKIILIRSAVVTRQMGFLPGSLQEKMALFELPYKDIVNNLIQVGGGYNLLKEKDALEFMSTSYLRGLTFDNALIIVDEIQNCNLHELSSVLTRVGKNSRIILCGDGGQDDLHVQQKRENSGFNDILRICSQMKSFDCIRFSLNDIVRSDFVAEFLIAKHNLGLE